MTIPGRWKKSSFSGQTEDCIELSGDLDAMRDSKNAIGPTLVVDMRPLIDAIKTGKLHA